jgi:hypothetical protein
MCKTSVPGLLADLEGDVGEAVVHAGELFVEGFGSCRDNMVLLVERYEHVLHSECAMLE